MYQKPKKVYLHGKLKKGMPKGPFLVYGNTVREIAGYFEANFGGFYDKIRDMQLWVLQGDMDGDLQKGNPMYKDQMDWNVGGEEIHFVPETVGNKRGGIFKAIIGALLIGAAIFFSGGTLAGLGGAFMGNALGITGTQVLMMGAGLVLSAFSQPPKSDYKDREAPAERPSSIYQGAINTQEQGAPVPLVLGQNVIVGGVIISAALDVEQM